MDLPQKYFDVSFPRVWRIRRPNIFRYLNRKWVDAFFEDGTLRLSSFVNFSNHKGKERCDAEEGNAQISIFGTGGKGPSILASQSWGQDVYVLCGSTLYDDDLASAFDCDSGFRINDTIAFADRVSSYLPGFVRGVEGPCIYKNDRGVIRILTEEKTKSIKENPDALAGDFASLQKITTDAAMDEPLFLKEKKYSHQFEYRLLWKVRERAVNESLTVKCPEARKFCTHFEELKGTN